MRKLILSVLGVAGLLAATAAPAAAQDTATAIRFKALNIDCSSSVGTASFTVKVSATPIGTFPFTQGCACNSAPMNVTITDPAALALVGAPACTLFSVTTNDPQGGAYVGYVAVEIDRTLSGTESICIEDYAGFAAGGGSCAPRDVCTGYQFSPGTVANALPDTDGDGIADCSDADDDGDGVLDAADNCPTTPNADQADSNGNGIGNACEPRAITVPWLGSPTQPHQVFSGGQLILQGTVRMDPSFTVTAASWDPGDGSAAVALSAPFNPRALELSHTYSGTDGTPYIAVLSVTVSNGTTTMTVSDTFRVVVRTKTLDVEANMAIDKGLWYLHKTMTLGASAAGVPSGSWTSGDRMAATASAVQALQINNHREGGNRDEDPYVDDVARGLVHLFDNLAPLAIGVQAAGDPDTNGNGIGLTLSAAASSPEVYILGQVVDAIVASGTQTAVVGVGDATYVQGRTYRDIVQDLMDAYYWGQADPGHGAHRGGWWYDLDTGADTSTSQWAAIGGLAAASWGIPVPAFVKSELLLWVDQSSFFDGSNAGIDGRFDYDGGNGSGSIFSQSAAASPSGLIEMTFAGVASTSAQFKSTERYISRLFYASNVWQNETHIYGMFALAKGFRLASPPVTTLDATGNATPLANFDWYRSEPVGGAPMGVARILVNTQQTSGRWDAPQWVTDHLSTAWGVIILSPTIFQLGPTAVCDVEPSTTGVGGLVSFDASGSFHNDPGGAIASYSWNFTDASTAAGVTATHAFAATGTYNVVLTVTDSNGLTDTESCTVNIVAGAIPPNSNPGGPYAVCSGQTSVTLNGSASTDPDGTIVSYEWDWTAPLNFATVDATGATPNASVFASMAPGTHDVALRVTDNNGNTNTDFTTVTVKPADDPSCNLPPGFTPPANVTTPATSAAGAIVTFTATGTDPEDGSIAAVCTPASGSTFAIGTTTVNCTVTDSDGATATGSFTVTVTPSNSAPVCSAATPSISQIWPANHKLVSVNILGVTDPDGGAVAIQVRSIFQDEPTNTQGDGNTPIDAYGIGTATAQVRAERSGTPKVPGNGRMYHITFTATDAQGASCTGVVKVGVPHDQGKGKVVVDGGPLFNSSGS
jgi:chitodextrinase